YHRADLRRALRPPLRRPRPATFGLQALPASGTERQAMNATMQFQSAHSGRIAVHVDGDNLSASHACAVVACATRLGQTVVARVYGNVRNLPRWDAEPAFRLMHSGTGKNATDVLMTIEAVELAHAAAADGFVLATSDGDFAHLARHLRARRFAVI